MQNYGIMLMKALSFTTRRLIPMFSRRLPINAVPYNEHDGTKMRKMMTIIAWFCLIAGVVLSLLTITNYSDQNHILMIGIGFLIASVFIYIIGLFMALMFSAPQMSQSTSNLDDEETK